VPTPWPCAASETISEQPDEPGLLSGQFFQNRSGRPVTSAWPSRRCAIERGKMDVQARFEFRNPRKRCPRLSLAFRAV
jgi:hypothetical protein